MENFNQDSHCPNKDLKPEHSKQKSIEFYRYIVLLGETRKIIIIIMNLFIYNKP